MPIFQKKITVEIFGQNAQTFHCSDYKEKFMAFSPEIPAEIFFLKIDKVYTKKVPNIEECKFIHASIIILVSTKQIIEVLHYQGEQLYEPVCKSFTGKSAINFETSDLSLCVAVETCNTAMEPIFRTLLGNLNGNPEKCFYEAKFSFFWFEGNSDI